MVHGLETIRALNAKKACSKPQKKRDEQVPERYQLNPYLSRKFVNRPWQKQDGIREPARI